MLAAVVAAASAPSIAQAGEDGVEAAIATWRRVAAHRPQMKAELATAVAARRGCATASECRRADAALTGARARFRLYLEARIRAQQTIVVEAYEWAVALESALRVLREQMPPVAAPSLLPDASLGRLERLSVALDAACAHTGGSSGARRARDVVEAARRFRRRVSHRASSNEGMTVDDGIEFAAQFQLAAADLMRVLDQPLHNRLLVHALMFEESTEETATDPVRNVPDRISSVPGTGLAAGNR